jgi:hypothetical protein
MAASPERAAVAWAKADAGITGLVGTRVATRLPADATLPFLTVRLIGGGPEAAQHPTDLYNMQFDCWAGTASDADLLMRALIDAARATQNQSNGHGLVYAIQIGGVLRDDPTDPVDEYRYVVDAFIHLHA